jgi:GNAT superfamily N-acetyltransferase
VYVDVVWRGRSVSRLTIQPDGAGGESGGSWWLSGAYTQPLQRNRGAAGLALAEAIARARGGGVAAVYAAVSREAAAARAVLTSAGFAPVEPERAQDLMQRRDPPVDPPSPDAVVYCLRLSSAP